MTNSFLELFIRILVCLALYGAIHFISDKKQFIIESLGEPIYKLNIFAFWFMLIGNLVIFITDYTLI